MSADGWYVADEQRVPTPFRYWRKRKSFIVKPIDLDSFVSALKSFEDFWLNVVRLPGDEERPGRA